MNNIIEAAKAVVARWKTPLWKEAEPTATFIYALRDAIADYEERKSEPIAECTNSDSWNCKYCNKTENCKASKDPRNFGVPAVKLKFPVMLRKMWSGSEVQAWLDENLVYTSPQPDAVKDALEEAIENLPRYGNDGFDNITKNENGWLLYLDDVRALIQPKKEVE